MHILFNPDQSGFQPYDSCLYQLVEITHNIFQPFGCSLETRAVFLDISKASEKVCHKGLISKLQSMNISGNFLNFQRFC